MLSPKQKEIVEQSGNVVVGASAGTGKTFTMVSKIENDIKINKSHKVIAAITFTVKAANEIKNRINIDTRDHFVGTNNSFAIEEIIKPFMKDVYGNEYKVEMSTDYSIKFYTIDEGLSMIRDNHILGVYYDTKDNFVFELALNILKNSKACQLYLKAKYFKIYIDEYQDCDKDMHNLFMYICDVLKIDIFVVGDEKQSIYTWRGAYPDAFLEIFKKDNFSKFYLRENYRSCQQIQNYSNLLCPETRELYQEVDDLSSLIILCSTNDNWISRIVSFIELDKKCALLRYSNKDSEKNAIELSNNGIEFTYIKQTPISTITTTTTWLYNSIAKYFILPKYSEYDFKSEIPNEVNDNKKTIHYIKQMFSNMKKYVNSSQIKNFKDEVNRFANYFGYETTNEQIDKLYETICDERNHPAFYIDELKNVAITFHSSKGLEFDQVILFASDFKLCNLEEIYNHYVASTRAKTKLIIVYFNDNKNCRTFAKNINKILLESNLKMREVATVIR